MSFSLPDILVKDSDIRDVAYQGPSIYGAVDYQVNASKRGVPLRVLAVNQIEAPLERTTRMMNRGGVYAVPGGWKRDSVRELSRAIDGLRRLEKDLEHLQALEAKKNQLEKDLKERK